MTRAARVARRAGMLLAAQLILAAPAAANVDPTDLEDEVVCIQCQRALSTSAGSAADDQRAFIQRLAEQGLTKDEIKDRLVEEYGERVLVDDASPIAAAAPWVAGIGGLAAVAFVLTRRARRDGEPADGSTDLTPDAERTRDDASTPAPSPADDARIDAELAALELED